MGVWLGVELGRGVGGIGSGVWLGVELGRGAGGDRVWQQADGKKTREEKRNKKMTRGSTIDTY